MVPRNRHLEDAVIGAHPGEIPHRAEQLIAALATDLESFRAWLTDFEKGNDSVCWPMDPTSGVEWYRRRLQLAVCAWTGTDPEVTTLAVGRYLPESSVSVLVAQPVSEPPSQVYNVPNEVAALLLLSRVPISAYDEGERLPMTFLWLDIAEDLCHSLMRLVRDH